MHKIDSINEFIVFIVDLVNDEFPETIDYMDSLYYFSNGGCHELAKLIKHYFKESQYLLKKDGTHCAILYEGKIYDVFDGLTKSQLEENNIPKELYEKRLEDFDILSDDEFMEYINGDKFGCGKDIIINDTNDVSEGIVRELDKITSITVGK